MAAKATGPPATVIRVVKGRGSSRLARPSSVSSVQRNPMTLNGNLTKISLGTLLVACLYAIGWLVEQQRMDTGTAGLAVVCVALLGAMYYMFVDKWTSISKVLENTQNSVRGCSFNSVNWVQIKQVLDETRNATRETNAAMRQSSSILREVAAALDMSEKMTVMLDRLEQQIEKVTALNK